MKLEEFFSDPVRTREYQEWLKNPVTVRVLEILDELCVPLPLPAESSANLGDLGLYHLGYNIGQVTTMRLLRGLDMTSAKLKETQRALNPDYGASAELNY